MFSQDDDRDNRFALGLIFLLVAVVVAAVVAFGAFKARGHKAKAPAVATAASVAPAAATSATAVAPAPSSDAARVVVEGGVVKFYFASGKAELAQDGAKALADILASAKAGKKIGISGFVDPSGDPAKNAELAKQRAFAVRDLLLGSGIAENQIVLVRPSDIKAGATSAAEGRRVEVFTL